MNATTMNGQLEKFAGPFPTANVDFSESLKDVSRASIRSTFGSAFWALVFALGLPLTVAVFGSIRAREFHFNVDSRWARYVPFSGDGLSGDRLVKSPDRPKLPRSKEPVRLPSQVASTHLNSQENHQRPRITIDVPDSMEAVSTQDQVEIITKTDSEAATKWEIAVEAERYETPIRGLSDDRDSQIDNVDIHEVTDETKLAIKSSTDRIESHVTHVRSRLDQLVDQLARQQTDSHEEELHRVEILEQQNQLLKSEMELARSLERFRDNLNVNAATLEKPIFDKNSVEEPGFAVSPQGDSRDESVGDDSIRIHRSTGRDMVSLFTIDAHDADIRHLFVRFSEVAGVGILTSPDVQGRISFHVPGVKFEAALKAIVRSHNFVVEREHGIIVIRTAEEAARRKAAGGKIAMRAESPK